MADAADSGILRLWSDNPNAPDIPYFQYVDEKIVFAGTLIGSILYGTRRTPTPTSVYPRSLRPFGYSRDHRHTVLPVYGRLVQTHPSQRGWRQVGTRTLHRGHVLVCDDVHRDEPHPPIRFLH